MKRLFMSKRAAVVAAMLAMPAALAFTGAAEAAPVATETMTMLSGGGKSGESITVVEGTAVTNHATLTGANAASATGIVTYKVYSDQECTKEVASAGAMEVSAGTVPASNPQTLAPGTYYWQASYGGDENNEASASRCGSEVETVVVKPSVKARFTCTSVTYFFSNFPNAPNNTIRERIFVGTTLVYRGTYTFDGPTGSNTVAVNVPPGHHRVDAEASWSTNGVKGSKDMPAFQGVTCPPRVYVGYADSNPNQPNAHPTPWQGEAGVIFEGCGYGGTDSCPMSGGTDVYDAGAIRIDAPPSGMVVIGASVQIGPCSYEPWPGLNVSVPGEGILILTETGKHKCTETNAGEQDNFDTSESFLKSTQYQEFRQTGECSNDGYIPVITLTFKTKTMTLNDTGQVLNGGGMDPDLCLKINEAHNWVRIQ